jgi:hypothetical protein
MNPGLPRAESPALPSISTVLERHCRNAQPVRRSSRWSPVPRPRHIASISRLNGTPAAILIACRAVSASVPPPKGSAAAKAPCRLARKIRCTTGTSGFPPAVIVSMAIQDFVDAIALPDGEHPVGCRGPQCGTPVEALPKAGRNHLPQLVPHEELPHRIQADVRYRLRGVHGRGPIVLGAPFVRTIALVSTARGGLVARG